MLPAAMGKKRPKEYTYALSERDELVVSFETLSIGRMPARLVSFCIAHRTKIDGLWHEVIRYDNAHGKPHLHRYYLRKKERRIELGDADAAPKIFNDAREKIKTAFEKLREHYIND
jgi:hypothetical protein